MASEVNLEAWEYEHASSVGIRRYTANWGVSDAKHYDRSRMEDDRTAQVAAAICELAVAKHTNQYWHAHVWPNSEHSKYKNMPDVGTSIEVRRIRTRRQVALRKHQLGKGLVLFVAEAVMPELRSVIVHGSIDYDYAWHNGIESDYAPQTTRLFPIERLNPNG